MKKNYDLIIIGAGAAGLMSALNAYLRGLDILILEKNERIGQKILITGKGRCNITTANTDTHEFIKKFGDNGRFLYSALSQFSIQDTIDFFNNYLNIETKIERGNRIFPVSNSAREITETFSKVLQDVPIKFNTTVLEINKNNILTNNGRFYANNFLLATGGKSYPSTGSTGDGYFLLKKIGHTIIKPTAALTPFVCQENFIKELKGLSLRNVNISAGKISLFGEALFTENGLSGPIILDLSSRIKLPSKISIDFKPALDHHKLDKRVLRDFHQAGTKIFKNSLDNLLPKKLIPVIIKLSKIDQTKPCNLITKKERLNLINLLKNFEVTATSVVGFHKSIVTKGGVSLKEVEPKTMCSKIQNNLYLAGEVLNLDGPTGGYNLQIAWSTGYVAGLNIKNE
ncbi:MAG: NAD(P)/FAD-dependent oxidoreductase [bacterium]|nr:NAD(P)/FAD-dependent oxidoreductase [bacterium]